MRILLQLLITLLVCLPARGWEHLVTKDGTRIEGDVTQPEFVLKEPSGSEMVIPRYAIDHLESTGDEMTATLKDGTVLVGAFEGKLEIEDGLIKRRYVGSVIDSVEFDTYIPAESEGSYDSCPIRVSLSASNALTSASGAGSTAATGSVTCQGLRILHAAFTRRGDVAAGEDTTVTVRFTISTPAGPDQLAELALDLVQEDRVVATARKRFTLDEDEVSTVPLKLDIDAEGFRQAGPEPRFRVQLVTQDESQEVRRGGFFWWFTIPIQL